jgi:hypothetical protein
MKVDGNKVKKHDSVCRELTHAVRVLSISNFRWSVGLDTMQSVCLNVLRYGLCNCSL